MKEKEKKKGNNQKLLFEAALKVPKRNPSYSKMKIQRLRQTTRKKVGPVKNP